MLIVYFRSNIRSLKTSQFDRHFSNPKIASHEASMGSENARSRRHTAPRRRSNSYGDCRDKRSGKDRREYADQDRKDDVRQSRKRTRDQVTPVPAKRYRSRSLEREREGYEYPSNRYTLLKHYTIKIVKSNM